MTETARPDRARAELRLAGHAFSGHATVSSNHEEEGQLVNDASIQDGVLGPLGRLYGLSLRSQTLAVGQPR